MEKRCYLKSDKMKQRFDIKIDEEIANNFRKMFCRKKGDISSLIEKLMVLELKREEIMIKR